MIEVETATRCSCGCPVTIVDGQLWTALCRDCYDGTEDAGERAHVIGRGKTPHDALWNWQDAHDEAWEVEWHLADLPGEIAQQVSIEAERQRGWVLTGPDTDKVAAWYPRYWLPPTARETP
jgi:hypothetical protein